MALTAGTILGQYEIRSPLGAGGMGEVYRAHDTRLDREVAIKVLPESLDLRSRPLAPLRAGSAGRRRAESSQHPCRLRDGDARRCAVHGDGTAGGRDAARAARRGPMPLRKAIDYAVQIAHGLAAAHDKRHRPSRPEAGEPVRHQGWTGQDPRLRPGQARPIASQLRPEVGPLGKLEPSPAW